MSISWTRVAAVAGAAAAIAIGGGRLATATSPPEEGPPVGGQRTITVSGTGMVAVDPDTATVTLGVEATAPTGEEAMAEVNGSAAALTEALIDSGVAEEDIQTTNLSLWSVYGTDGREVTGYQASLNVTVTIHGIDDDISRVGATIDAAQQAAGPGFTISGVSFSFADPESVLEPARVDALASARRSAEQYAAAAGATLGAVVSIVEHGSTPPIVYDGDARPAVAEDAAGPPISPGQLDLQVTITVTFAVS